MPPARWLLFALIAGSALAIATVHLTTLLVVAVGALIVVVASVDGRTRIQLPVWVTLALAILTLLQAVPLPAVLARFLSPEAISIRGLAWKALGEPLPSWVALSLAPSASLVEALKWFTYAMVLLVAVRVGQSRNGSGAGVRQVAMAVFVSALLVALVTVIHGAAHAQRVYGFYQPTFTPGRWTVGPFLNENNLAGYLNLGAFCGLGLLVRQTQPVGRALLGAGVAALVGVALLGGSRGGALSLVLGVVLFAGFLALAARRARHRSQRLLSRSTVMATAATLGVAGILAAFGAITTLAEQERGESKLQVFVWTSRLIEDFPVVGVGRGAFGTVFTAYAEPLENRVFSSPENFLLQWASEWGVLATLVAAGCFVWCIVPVVRAAASRPTLAALTSGSMALAVQNLVDLGFEVPAICIAMAAVLGVVWGSVDARRRREALRRRSSSWPLRLRLAFGSCAAALVGAAAVWGAPTVDGARTMVERQLEAANTTTAVSRLRRSIREQLSRFPADPYFSRLGALVAWRTRQDDPIRWLNHSLSRDMTNGRTHLLLARVLVQRKVQHQALLHARLAVEHDPMSIGPAASIAVKTTQDFEQLARAAPRNVSGSKMLYEMALRLRKPEQREVRTRCLREAIKRNPQLIRARVRLARDQLAVLSEDNPEGPCSGKRRARCVAEVEAMATKLASLTPHTSAAVEMRARLMMVQGDPAAAARLLEQRCLRYDDPVGCLKVRVEAAMAAGSETLIASAVEALTHEACPPAKRCAAVESWLGDRMAERGDWRAAMQHYQRSARQVPRAASWRKLADAASRAGKRGTALMAAREAAQLSLRSTRQEASHAKPTSSAVHRESSSLEADH